MAPNYTDSIIITSSAIKGFSNPTFVRSQRIRQGEAPLPQAEHISMRAPCARRRERGLPPGAHSPAGRQPGKEQSCPAARSLATLPASLCPQCPACSPVSPRSWVDGLHQLEDELLPSWRGDDAEQGMCYCRKVPRQTCSPKAPWNLC